MPENASSLRPARGWGAGLRGAVYVLTLPWLAVVATGPSPGLPYYLGGILVVAAGVLVLPRLAPALVRSAAARGTEIVAWNLLILLLLCEAGVRLYLVLGSPPGWLVPEPDHQRYRLDPGQPLFGTAANSRGFYDREFGARTPGVRRVVALGDSYNVGVVPYRDNYLTLIDDALGDGIEVLNLGVVHMAVRQYLEILRDDGLALEPDLVLLGIYIGNDIRRDPPRGLLSRAGLRSLTIGRRVFKVLVEGESREVEVASGDLFHEDADGTRIEHPMMSVEKHHAREWKHLRRLFRPPTSRRMRDSWRDTEAALTELVELCRARAIPVVATLAPDEIQVASSVLDAVLERYGADPRGFDLDYPGRRLRVHLDGLGVPVLDLTPALRAAERDGATYHLRAVHWNRHGNAAVARVLAPWLATRLAALSGPD